MVPDLEDDFVRRIDPAVEALAACCGSTIMALMKHHRMAIQHCSVSGRGEI